MSTSLVVILLLAGVSVSSSKTRRDTYLTAYMESHGPSLPPGEVYGTPAGDYGAPTATGYNYGAPAEPHKAPENPLDPVHAKIVLLFKVLLKLLIFKIIVKFIAIICVFLFLPKLSGLGLAKEAADDARKVVDKGDEDHLQLTQFVLDAVSGAPLVCRTEDGLCRLRRALDFHTSFPRLFGMYLKEEEEKLRHKTVSRKRRN